MTVPAWCTDDLGGGALNFFGGVCATQVSKSRVKRADFPWKMRGLGNENLENLRLEGWNFDQNKAENAIFFSKKIENGGGGTVAHWW